MTSNQYLAARIRDAIGQAGGDVARAQRLITEWAARDDRLLRMLVAPYIRGIVGQAIQQHTGVPATKAPARKRADAPLAGKNFDAVVGRMGERFGGAIEQPRGMSALIQGPDRKPAAAGKRHADSLRTLAVAFARKRFDPSA